MQESYGSPELLRVAEVDKPTVTDDRVLVRVRAVSLNAGDWRRVRAAPFLVRAVEGLRKPRNPLLGGDASGEVEEIGKNVTHVKPGDRVFGVGIGTLSEYSVGKAFVPMPADLSFEQAACIPIAGLTALQAVRDKGKVQRGDKVLVIGAGGGVGTFALQIAKAFHAEVTAVTSTGKIELVKSIGADHVVDYTRESFIERDARYNAIIDSGGTPSISACRGALAAGGRLVLVAAGSGWGGPVGRMAAGAARLMFLRQKVFPFIAKVAIDDLLVLKALIETGKVTPVIDRTYALAETADALSYLESQQVSGKLIVTI